MFRALLDSMRVPTIVALLALCNSASAQTSEASARAAGTTVQHFVPKSYEVAAQVRADFNRDTKQDIALIVWESRQSEKARSLIILLRQKDGSYQLAAKTDKLVPGGNIGCGAANPYCVPELTAKGDTLKVSWRNGIGMTGDIQEFEFRYLRNGFYLTGIGIRDWSPEGCLNDDSLKLRRGERCVFHGVRTNLVNGQQTEVWSIQREEIRKERTVKMSRSVPKASLKPIGEVTLE